MPDPYDAWLKDAPKADPYDAWISAAPAPKADFTMEQADAATARSSEKMSIKSLNAPVIDPAAQQAIVEKSRQQTYDAGRLSPEYIGSKVPFVGMAQGASNAYDLANASKRVQAGAPTPYDLQVIGRHIGHSQWQDERASDGVGTKLADFLAGAPAAVGEWAALGGLGGPARAAATGLAERTLGGWAAKGLAGQVVGATAEGLARTLPAAGMQVAGDLAGDNLSTDTAKAVGSHAISNIAFSAIGGPPGLQATKQALSGEALSIGQSIAEGVKGTAKFTVAKNAAEEANYWLNLSAKPSTVHRALTGDPGGIKDLLAETAGVFTLEGAMRAVPLVGRALDKTVTDHIKEGGTREQADNAVQAGWDAEKVGSPQSGTAELPTEANIPGGGVKPGDATITPNPSAQGEPGPDIHSEPSPGKSHDATGDTGGVSAQEAAATTAEVTSADSTGIKNETVNAERSARSEAPLIEAAKRRDPEVWNEALQKIKDDPGLQDRLIAELSTKPRSVSDTENALLMHRKVDLSREFDRTDQALDAAKKTGDAETIALAENAQRDALRNIRQMDDVTKATGREQARGFRWRQLMAEVEGQDYSLPRLLGRAKESLGREPTPEETSELRTLQKENQEFRAKLDAHESIAERRKVEDSILGTERNTRTEKARKEVDAAWDKFSKVTQGLSANRVFDPAVLEATYDLAKAYVKLNVAKVADFIKLAQGEDKSDEYKAMLMAQFEKAKAENPVESAKEPKSSLHSEEARAKAAKTRLQNQIDELSKQIDSGEKIVKDKSTPNYDEETKKLIEKRDALKEKYDEVFGSEGKTEEQRLADYKKRAQARIDELSGQIESGQKLPKESRSLALDEEAKSLASKRDKLQEEFDATFGKPDRAPMSEEAKLKSFKTRMQSQIDAINAKIETGDLSKLEPRQKLTLDPEAQDLQARLNQSKAKIEHLMQQYEQSQQNAVQKTFRYAGAVIDLQRAIKLGGDLPPILRQGGFVALSHPIVATKALFASLKAYGSKLAGFHIGAGLEARENAQNGYYKRFMGLDVSNPHGMDEFMQSALIEKVPIFGAMERGHSVFTTHVLADHFDLMTAGFADGKLTEAQGKIIGNAVNVLSGRGNLGQAEQAVGLLNKVFLAPKWVASRFQTVVGQPLWHGVLNPEIGLQPRARLAVAKEYVKYGAGLSALYGMIGLGIAGGLKAMVETDTRSSDFGEIRIGNTRINPLSGFSQAIRFMGQFWTGEREQVDTGKVMKVGRGELAGNEFRKKLAPLPSTAWTGTEIYHGQKTPPGYPTTATETATDLITPLTVEDFYKASQDLGLPRGVVAGILGSLGMGVKTYQPKKKLVPLGAD